MQKLIKMVLGCTLLLTSFLTLAGGDVMVDNAWIREAPPGATSQAGYMTLNNHSDAARTLVGASSPAFGNVMLHRTVMEGGTAKMVHQMAIEIPANGSVTFEPNGYHLMLMKPKQQLKAGDKVDIALKFKSGKTMKVTFEVRPGMGGMDHSGMGGMDHMDHSKMKH